jgi:hypothetical protein
MHMAETEKTGTDPVEQLLLLGAGGSPDIKAWPDYPADFGLDHSHVGALIDMACDPNTARALAAGRR